MTIKICKGCKCSFEAIPRNCQYCDSCRAARNRPKQKFCLICHKEIPVSVKRKCCSEKCQEKWDEFIGKGKDPVRDLSRMGTETYGRKQNGTFMGGYPKHDRYDEESWG